MATCLCDAFFADVARATVQVLEYFGCEVNFPEDQTCCGQPAFNGGDWTNSRKVVRHTIKVFQGNDPVVVPSGSCAAMIFHGAALAFEKEADIDAVRELGGRTWEVADYLVNGLGVESIPGQLRTRIAFHQSCHSRGTQSGPAARRLLQLIDGIEVLPFDEPEQCCGFGGAFSVSFPVISGKMGQLKIEKVLEVEPEYLVSADMGCLLHLQGILVRGGHSIPCRHMIQLVRDALVATGEIREEAVA